VVVDVISKNGRELLHHPRRGIDLHIRDLIGEVRVAAKSLDQLLFWTHGAAVAVDRNQGALLSVMPTSG